MASPSPTAASGSGHAAALSAPLAESSPVASAELAHSQGTQLRTKRARALDDLRGRMFDPKQRLFGIDKAALDEQVKEKQAIRAQEKAADDYYAQQALLQDKYGMWLDKEQAKERHEIELEAQQFRHEKQRSGRRREADLNDPKQLKRELPARIGDSDPRCTVSGCQKFEGEDLDAGERKKVQAFQQLSWAEQQVREKNLKKQLEKEMDQLQADRTEAVTHKAWACERAIEQTRADRARATAEFNKSLAAQKAREKLAAKHFEQKCNMQEIQNMLDSDFLSEDSRVTLNPQRGPRTGLGAPAYRSDNMKGLHDDQRASILAEQAAQRRENAARREADKQEQMQVNLQEEQERRMAIALDRQRERDRRADRLRLAGERQQQAHETAQKRANLDALYCNQISEDFYSFVHANPR